MYSHLEYPARSPKKFQAFCTILARRAEKRSAFRRRSTPAMMAQCPILADTVYRAAPFFTVNLLERRDWLIRHIALLRMAVHAVRRARPFYIDEWVVLSDHLHCLWTLPLDDADYSSCWRAIQNPFC